MKIRRSTGKLAAFCAAAMMAASCWIYSFSGTSIQPDVNTITINFIEYKALNVNPTLSNELTEAIRTQFRKMTRLEQVDMDGDLEISGQITDYNVAAASVTANETVDRNRLTVQVKIQYTNAKYPEEDFDKNFTAYADYDASQSLDAVQDALCQEIIDKLVEDIFNASVAQW